MNHPNLAWRDPRNQERRVPEPDAHTVAIPDYRSTPGNKGAYALRRMEDDTAMRPRGWTISLS